MNETERLSLIRERRFNLVLSWRADDLISEDMFRAYMDVINDVYASIIDELQEATKQ